MKIQLKGIYKKYKTNTILTDINFHVNQGEFLTILGKSGSGKSSILKSIAGLIEPDQGQIFLEGRDITTLRTEERGIAYVFQSSLLFPHLTVRENIAFGLQIKKLKQVEIDQEVNRLLTLLRIEELANRLPAQISGGQQQRVAIARALATKPSVILMDEPFSALDMTLRQEMGTLIKELQQLLELTIIFVTHDIDESLRLSDKIVLIDQGKVLQFDDAKAVYYRPLNKNISLFMGQGNWIDGTIKDEVFHCSFGAFSAKDIKDGHATLFFRPHQLKLSKETDSYRFKINNIMPLGKQSLIEVIYGQQHLLVEIYQDNTLEVGEEVSVEFPRDKVWII